MAKPTLLPRHAETAGGTPDGNITEPSSGEKDSGFVAGTAASSAKTNWILWIIYLWIKWLDGTITTKQVKRVARRRQAPLHPARVVRTSGINNGTEVVTAAGVFVRQVSLDGGSVEIYSNTDAPALFIPITLDEDEQLESIKVRFVPVDAADQVTVKLYRINVGVADPTLVPATKTQLGATATSVAAGAGIYQTLTVSGVTELLDGTGETGEWYVHWIEIKAAAFSSGYAVHGVSVYASVPTPP